VDSSVLTYEEWVLNAGGRRFVEPAELERVLMRNVESGPEDWALGARVSTAEGPRKFEMEKAAIDEAYCRQIKDLFGAFHFASCKAAEKNALAKFKADLEALRRSYIQALSIFSDHHQM